MGRAGLLEPIQSLPVSVKSAVSGSLRRCTSSPPQGPSAVCTLQPIPIPELSPLTVQLNQNHQLRGLIDGMGQYGFAKSLGIGSLSVKTFIARYFARTLALPNTCSAPKNKPQSKASSRPCPAAASTCPTSATKTPTPALEPNAPPSTPPCRAQHPTSSNAP